MKERIQNKGLRINDLDSMLDYLLEDLFSVHTYNNAHLIDMCRSYNTPFPSKMTLVKMVEDKHILNRLFKHAKEKEIIEKITKQR